jgi:gas vesicle protein
MYREDQSGGNFILGVLTGAFVGAGLALLFAPKPGTEMRAQLGEQYRGLADRVGEQTQHLRESAGQLRQQGRERMHDLSGRLSDRMSSGRQATTEPTEAERFPSSAPTL